MMNNQVVEEDNQLVVADYILVVVVSDYFADIRLHSSLVVVAVALEDMLNWAKSDR